MSNDSDVRANVSVDARVVNANSGTVSVVGPSVTALGPGSMTITEESTSVKIYRVFAEGDDQLLGDWQFGYGGAHLSHPAMPSPKIVMPGETVAYSVLFRVDPMVPDLVGWLVVLKVASHATRAGPGGHCWGDEVFVGVGRLPREIRSRAVPNPPPPNPILTRR
jgi:hypothetical protein